jgi:hypothetical protein
MVSFSSFWGPADDAYSLLVNKPGIRKGVSRLIRRRGLAIEKEVLRTAVQAVSVALGVDPFAITNLDATVVVTWPDHRLSVGDPAFFTGSDALGTITAAVINRATGHVVTVVTDEDTFEIEISDPGTTDAAIGGASVVAAAANNKVLRADTLLATKTQITPAQHLGDAGPGGVRPVASVDIVNRAIVAADLTDVDSVLTEQRAPSTYPADASGNGGGGKLGR